MFYIYEQRTKFLKYSFFIGEHKLTKWRFSFSWKRIMIGHSNVCVLNTFCPEYPYHPPNLSLYALEVVLHNWIHQRETANLQSSASFEPSLIFRWTWSYKFQNLHFNQMSFPILVKLRKLSIKSSHQPFSKSCSHLPTGFCPLDFSSQKNTNNLDSEVYKPPCPFWPALIWGSLPLALSLYDPRKGDPDHLMHSHTRWVTVLDGTNNVT